jgi:uncharacterized membrane protein
VADLLTHVLAAAVLATVLSRVAERITPAAVSVAMVGGLLPDLNRIELVVPASAVASVLGVPFSWDALGTVGGVAVAVSVGALLVPSRHRRTTVAMLSLGASAHFLLDYLLSFPAGYAHPYLYPLTDHALPGPNLYLSSDRWPTVVAVAVAAAVGVVTRRR